MRSCLALPFVLVACASSNSGGTGVAADAGRVDAPDARLVSDASSPDASADAPRDPDAGALSGEAGGAWVDAFAAMNSALCACSFGPRGYDSAAQCQATEGTVDPAVRACAVAAFARHGDALGGGFGCQRAGVRDAADCYAASGCEVDALNACDAALNMARRACANVPDSAISAFFGDAGSCTLGEPSACPEGEVLTGVGAALGLGNTVGQGDDFLGSCGSGPAPDVALRYRAQEAGSYRFDTHGSSFDTELVAYDGCDAARELGCSEDDGERYTSEITLTLDADQEIVLVVDGFDGTAAGAYVLNVTRL